MILFIHPQKNAVLNLFLVNKQEKTKQQRFHISVFFVLFLFFLKKRATFALVRFPQQAKKHSYNLLHSMAINCSRPFAWARRAPEQTGARSLPEKASLLAKEHFFFFKTFSREKQKRYLFNG